MVILQGRKNKKGGGERRVKIEKFKKENRNHLSSQSSEIPTTRLLVFPPVMSVLNIDVMLYTQFLKI